jgi:hypothetical protein
MKRTLQKIEKLRKQSDEILAESHNYSLCDLTKWAVYISSELT